MSELKSGRAKGVEFTEDPHLVAKMPDHDLWMAFFKDTSGNILVQLGVISCTPLELAAQLFKYFAP
jgi:hypothetical protein